MTDDDLTDEEAAALREHGLFRATEFLDYLESGSDGDTIGYPDQPGGDCSDCGRYSTRRWTLGLFVLCRGCRTSRFRAGLKLVREATVVGPPDVIAPTNGNGNGHRDPEVVTALVQRAIATVEDDDDLPWTEAPDF